VEGMVMVDRAQCRPSEEGDEENSCEAERYTGYLGYSVCAFHVYHLHPAIGKHEFATKKSHQLELYVLYQ
jgi:hypothetical protein